MAVNGHLTAYQQLDYIISLKTHFLESLNLASFLKTAAVSDEDWERIHQDTSLLERSGIDLCLADYCCNTTRDVPEVE